MRGKAAGFVRGRRAAGGEGRAGGWPPRCRRGTSLRELSVPQPIAGVGGLLLHSGLSAAHGGRGFPVTVLSVPSSALETWRF